MPWIGAVVGRSSGGRLDVAGGDSSSSSALKKIWVGAPWSSSGSPPSSIASNGEAEIIVAAAPQLQPRLWYGMPGYAPSKSKPVICFFRVDGDDYVTLGLTEKAHHEPDATADHQLMPSAWFLTDLDPATEARITEIVQRAAG